MDVVRVKSRFQVTLPSRLREQVGVDVGDLLEAKIEHGKITLTPKSLVDRRLDEAMEDVRAGRVHGPFKSAEAMRKSLRRNAKKREGADTRS
jgi:AbrB family looped-hinge helix DNA binding protein